MSDETTDDPYQFHSSFPIREIEIVSDILEKENVDYQIDFDDSAIKRMDAVTANLGGTFGTGLQAHLYVHHLQIDKANAILKDMLGK
jgi:hypothetical protein